MPYDAQLERLKKVGNVRVFCFQKDGLPLIYIGPNWPFFFVILALTVMFSGLIMGMVIEMNRLGSPIWQSVTSLLMVVIGILSVFYTFLANPGIPIHQLLRKQVSTSGKYCNVCKIYVNDKRDFHCDECNVCIQNYDHHCIFFGKCIGGGNECTFNFALNVPIVAVMFTFCAYGY